MVIMITWDHVINYDYPMPGILYEVKHGSGQRTFITWSTVDCNSGRVV